MSSTRIALGIEYDGSQFFGWQRQREVVCVQEVLEQALSKIANHPVEVTCAGRTDAGVHATGQVVHFDCHTPRAMPAWTMGVNSRSEEHTSELQSRPHLVCRLLLEKKKKKK